ncbi:MAG: PAS domain S-box protein [Syntrophales bacterium]|nr:PAS domain S-box protein [Syntrophales bacterium]
MEKEDLLEEINRLQKVITELRASEGRYRKFLEDLPDGCFEIDLKGRFTFCNEALASSKGYSREEYLQLTPEKLFPPEELQRVMEVFQRVYETGKPEPAISYKMFCRDGSVRVYEMSISLIRDEKGQAMGFRGICRDVTEREKVEAENVLYREFIENIDDGCWEVDLRGNYTYLNRAAAHRHGYTPQELIGKNFGHLMRPEEVKRVRKVFSEIYRTGTPGFVSDYEVLGKDGDIHYLDVSATLIRDKDGKPVGFRGVSRDVTERKRLQEQMIRSQKFEAIATLAGGIAHSFNNILMGIQGHVDLMLIESEEGSETYQRLKAIEGQIKNAAELTKQLLTYAQIGRFEMKVLNLNVILDRIASLVSLTKKAIRIKRDFAPDLFSVKADTGQMEQVFMNLFINAWQAMPGGGVITLKTENAYLAPAEAVKYGVKAGNYVKVTVADTGLGMDAETLSRIFDPFFTTKEVGQGTGLGLAAVYGIVRKHGGIIDVRSAPDRGTTFMIFLPAVEEMVEKREETGEEKRGKKKILVVDDEAMVAQVTTAMLKALGYETLTARSGGEAVRIFREHKDEISLVIMDMTMPEGGGVAAIGKIKAFDPQVHIIAMSGFALEREARTLLEQGMIKDFLQKPFRLDDLSQVVRDVLAQ